MATYDAAEFAEFAAQAMRNAAELAAARAEAARLSRYLERIGNLVIRPGLYHSEVVTGIAAILTELMALDGGQHAAGGG